MLIVEFVVKYLYMQVILQYNLVSIFALVPLMLQNPGKEEELSAQRFRIQMIYPRAHCSWTVL